MRVVIVDDDRLVCHSLKTILEAEPEVDVLACGFGGEEAEALYERLRPDVLLMDIRMEGVTGLDAAERILHAHPGANILFLTTFSDDDYIVRALRIGAKGYLLKQEFDSIVPALKAVMSGQSVFGTDVAARLPAFLSGAGKPEGIDGLSPKENELATLVAEGLNNREIAAKLFLSEGTVRNGLSVVLEKLGLRDRTQLAVYYYRRGR